MRNILKQCVGWLDWRFVAGVLAAVAALALCSKLPSLSIFAAGVTPLLLIAACLLPCLIPLAVLRRRENKVPTHEHERSPLDTPAASSLVSASVVLLRLSVRCVGSLLRVALRRGKPKSGDDQCRAGQDSGQNNVV